ncbi:hypothetical protein BASA81_003075 [Batrachochytrium salamandrivorans]|nr:hypothetical protein BASA81_003075 [Batrachochytrium salamandrivorans]
MVAWWLLLTLVGLATAQSLQPPQTFSSKNKRLDVVMVAKPTRANLTFPFAPPHAEVWQYHVCWKTSAEQMDCPQDSFAPQGVNLKLQPGDLLKIRLVNRLATWRTNLHFHGMAVSTDYDNSTFGDYPYVIAYNSLVEPNPAPVGLPLILRKDFIDYKFPIPVGHPLGLYWFHPHNHEMKHGVMNEGNEEMMNAGLSGSITVGNLQQYVSQLGNTPKPVLVVRTTFFNSKWQLVDMPSPWFCNHTAIPLPGYCNGTGDNLNSTVYYTINSQVYPDIVVPSRVGMVLRLVQAMASVTIKISLMDSSTNQPIPFMALTVDGVSTLSPSANNWITEFFFMSGSRIELFIQSASKSRSAVLMGTGPSRGVSTTEYYPSVQLARVKFQSRGQGVNSKLPVVGQTNKVKDALEKPPRTDVECLNTTALKPNHQRRITFNALPGSDYGLAYAELDEFGVVVPGTATAVTMFDPDTITVCAKLGSTEIWELVNPSLEDHNFHIHQTKFKMISTSRQVGTGYLFSTKAVDSIPLPALSTTVVQIPFVRSGDYMYHCHLAYHSDHGMMARIRVAEKMKD